MKMENEHEEDREGTGRCKHSSVLWYKLNNTLFIIILKNKIKLKIIIYLASISSSFSSLSLTHSLTHSLSPSAKQLTTTKLEPLFQSHS